MELNKNKFILYFFYDSNIFIDLLLHFFSKCAILKFVSCKMDDNRGVAQFG